MATLALSLLRHRPAPESRHPWPALALLRELVAVAGALIGVRRPAPSAQPIAEAELLGPPPPLPEELPRRARRSAGI